jgi:ketosteroid isomerase-like protein
VNEAAVVDGMHPNARTIERLYAALQARDPDAMAACYADDATFRDIAFDLRGRAAILRMWRLVCSKKVRNEITAIHADEQKGRAHWEAHYRFGKRNRPVHNVTDAEFTFRGGRIVAHVDHADALAWARQAYGPVVGEVLGRVGPLRRFGARLKLKAFARENP